MRRLSDIIFSYIIYDSFLLLAILARAIRPDPSKIKEAGSGTGAGAKEPLLLKNVLKLSASSSAFHSKFVLFINSVIVSDSTSLIT